MTRAATVFTLLLALILFLPLGQWVLAVDPFDRFAPGAPAGQAFYTLAKLFALLGASLMILQVALVLLGGVLRRAGLHWQVSDHRLLGSLTVAAVIAHVGCFVTGASLRSGHVAWNLLLPDLAHGSYNRGVGLGVLAFWLLLAAVLAGAMHRRGPMRPGRRAFHRLAALAGLAGLAHGVWIGSEKGFVLLALLVAAVLALAGLRGLWRRPA